MIKQAASYLPEQERHAAIKAVVLTATGHSNKEIAKEVGLSTPKQVIDLKEKLGVAVVRLMRDQGLSDGEIARDIGVGTSLLSGRYSGHG